MHCCLKMCCLIPFTSFYSKGTRLLKDGVTQRLGISRHRLPGRIPRRNWEDLFFRIGKHFVLLSSASLCWSSGTSDIQTYIIRLEWACLKQVLGKNALSFCRFYIFSSSLYLTLSSDSSQTFSGFSKVSQSFFEVFCIASEPNLKTNSRKKKPKKGWSAC